MSRLPGRRGPGDAPADPSRPPTRRAVLQGAAWSAPAIVVATAAPATAASITQPLVTTVVTATQDPSDLTVTSVFTNTTPAPTTALTARVVLTPVLGNYGTTITVLTPEWVRAGASTGTGGVLTLDFVKATALGAAPDSTTLTFTITFAALSDAGTGNVRSTPSPTPGQGVAGTTQYAPAP